MTSKELRRKYIEFFKSKGHTEIPSASLVPENDPTVLFTTAGMHPLVPYLMGEKHPAGSRLVNVQKCVRTGDIDDVGDSTHNTFFEMLGNWSLGDYFKNESIRWSWEFLTDKKWLGIDPAKIKVTVFEGDKDAPRDEESIEIWKECYKQFNIEAEVYDKSKNNAASARIFPLPKEDNWWGPAGMTGPCGPDTEIFIDLGKPTNFDKCERGDDCRPGCRCGRYVEIWNNVFMQFEGLRTVVLKNKTTEEIMEIASCSYELWDSKDKEKVETIANNVKVIGNLPSKNVDTGMGIERTLAILNGFNNVYETDVFSSIIKKIGEISGKNYGNYTKEFRIIADHTRASVFMINDGVVPSNVERGYVLRRLLRRAIIKGRKLKMQENFLLTLAELVINNYREFYPELEKNQSKILEEIKIEEEKFNKALESGLKELERYVQSVIVSEKTSNEEKNMKLHSAPKELSSDAVFKLVTTFGVPMELVIEEAKERDLVVNLDEVNDMIKKHQDLSRTASAGKFKGGLADQGEQAVKYHTATHLLLESLRRVLGPHVYQKGSNITAERVRFDFSHGEKMTKEQVQKVEGLVNEQIQKNLPVTMQEMSLEDAKRLGAMGIFESKYGERVKVYTIGDEKTGIFSREICGGPHVKNSSELGKFKIKKEESSSAGVRRIKAVLE